MDKTPPTWLKVLRWVGYGLFFLFALVLCVRFTFPTDQARDFMKSQLAQRLNAQRVEIADVGINGLLPNGATLEGLEIEMAPVKMKTPERGVNVDGPPRIIFAEELSVSGSLMGLASQNYDVEFEGKIQGGELNGGRLVWEKGGPLSAEIAEMQGIALGSEGMFLSLTGFDIIATLGGKLKVEIPSVEKDGKSALQMEQMAANIELELSDAKIIQPIFDTVMSREQVRMTFTDTKLGTVKFKLTSEGGGAPATGGDAKGARRATVIAIEELGAVGGDIEIALAPKATITIGAGQTLKDAIVNVHLAVKVNDAWFDVEVKDPKDPTKKTKPNVGLRTMMNLGALKAYVQDGQFGVGITGPLGSPKVTLEKPRTRVGGGAGVGGGRKVNVDHGADEGGEDLDSPAPSPKPARTESRAKPVVTPPVGGNVGGNAERPSKTSITRPPVMGKGAPTANFGRNKPNLNGPSDAQPVEPHEAEEPHEEPPPAELEPGVEVPVEGEPLPEGGGD
jgi:type II secretion system protein N